MSCWTALDVISIATSPTIGLACDVCQKQREGVAEQTAPRCDVMTTSFKQLEDTLASQRVDFGASRK